MARRVLARTSRPRRWAWCAWTATALLAAGAGCGGGKSKSTAFVSKYPQLPAKEVPAYLRGTILERTDLAGTEGLLVNAYSLVVDLPGTGDSTAPTPVREFIIKEMLRRGFGSTLLQPGVERMTPERVLADPKAAIVRLDAFIPPGARRGQRFDAVVSVIEGNNTSNLTGGVVYRTDLKINGADPRAPSGQIETYASAEGPIFVNPVYSLDSAEPQGAAAASLRKGMILGGAVATQDRVLALRLRQPQLSFSRFIENRIDQHFQDPTVAAAQDEGIVHLTTPARFRGDWEHFAGLVAALHLNTAPDFVAARARELAEAAVLPDAPLLEISYAWEALGPVSLPTVAPLMEHPDPDVAFAAARAAAFLGDAGAPRALLAMAHAPSHPFRLTAVQTLGRLPPTPAVAKLLRELLEAPEPDVRIEAYRQLAAVKDGSIFSTVINDKFVLDVVPSGQPPLVYASRTGVPRLAILGNRPALELPVIFSAWGARLTISSQPGERFVTVFNRAQGVRRPAPVACRPDLAELVARLAGSGGADEAGLDLTYGDIVAVVRALAEQQMIMAGVADGRLVSAGFVLQDAPLVEDAILSAPPLPGDSGRPQGAPEEPPTEPTATSSAMK